MKRKNVAYTATAGAAVGMLGLAMLTLPAGAGAEPTLPRVTPEALAESVTRASPAALSGTVEVNNALGLPMIPGSGAASELMSDGMKRINVWVDVQGRKRVSVPSDNHETTMVGDGSALWTWDSATQQVTRAPGNASVANIDPASAARDVIGALRQSSNLAVDGTENVAGRDAYELVLTPKPGEHTKMREMRVAVDAEKRIPLRFSVYTNGSQAPAFQAGFSRIEMGSPDPGLFQFTPPARARVEERPVAAPQWPQLVGQGWDSVMVSPVPQAAQQDLQRFAAQTGKPVSGSWGKGWIIDTTTGNALVTSDGRMAVGAVSDQALIAALGEA